MREIKKISVMVPCHNEQEVLMSSHERISKILQEMQKNGKFDDYEILYVDNGSTDNTLNVLKNIFDSDKKARIISLRRNFGYQGSISAGLFYSTGDAVVTIDADLQDPPEKIEEMIGHYENGYDLVLGVRNDRRSDSVIKRYFAENYYRLIKLLGVDIVHNHGDFRLMSRSLVNEFNALSERNRFIRAMILQLESKYAIVRYKRQPRTAGKSKFNISSLFSISLDGLMSFTYVPLRLASLSGLLLCLLSVLAIFWVLYIKFATNVFPGWTSTLLPILALGGFQLLMLGMIGEYIGRLYLEVKQRPVFIVRDEYSHSK